MSLETINPATGETIKNHQTFNDQELESTLTRVDQSQENWSDRAFSERAQLMNKAAERLRENADSYAELMTKEMGKPLEQARSEVEKCAWVCNYYADHAEQFLADDRRESDAQKSYVSYKPLGVVLAIMPWNYPFWQVFRFAAPTLMAGNTAVLKHAPNVMDCAFRIENIFREAGFPEDTFRTLPITVEQTQSVIEHDRVKAVTLTGSTRAGKAVASQAGNQLKKTVLELGGSDPYLILEDADLDLAAQKCVTARMKNNGQSCIAAKRFVVVEDVYESFLERVEEKIQDLEMGDPTDPSVDIGPQARYDLRDELHDQVQRSIQEGASCRLGGEIPDREGAFYPPSLLTDLAPGNTAATEELFGPVAVALEAENENEALEIANNSDFGLGAAVFTEDIERGEAIARDELQAGCCFVNEFVSSDPRLPFGGIKQSGYGRELSKEGIREFVNQKTVYIS